MSQHHFLVTVQPIFVNISYWFRILGCRLLLRILFLRISRIEHLLNILTVHSVLVVRVFIAISHAVSGLCCKRRVQSFLLPCPGLSLATDPRYHQHKHQTELCKWLATLEGRSLDFHSSAAIFLVPLKHLVNGLSNSGKRD